MSSRTLVIVALCAAILAASPLIVRGVANFKTFLELQTLLNPCDGAGSSPPCRN